MTTKDKECREAVEAEMRAYFDGEYMDSSVVRSRLTEFWQAAWNRRAGEWQSIETAPKDGTEVWAFNGEQQRMKWIEGEGYGLWIHAEEVLNDIDPDPDQPTHYLPLPAAPQPPEGE